MTEPQLTIRVAEAEGWTHCEMVKLQEYRGPQPFGISPDSGYLLLPHYPTDPRAWAPLLEKMRDAIHDIDPAPEGEWIIQLYGDDAMHCAPTLGRAVCEAYIQWAEATQGKQA